MNDIVERLLDQETPTGHGMCQNCDGTLRDEAAAEIKRLRHMLEVSEACNHTKSVLIAEVRSLISDRTGPPKIGHQQSPRTEK